MHRSIARETVRHGKEYLAITNALSIATLLAQHNQVMAVDIIPEKVELINQKKSPIQDDYIEDYLANKELDLVSTLDAEAAYKEAAFVVIAAPTNYDKV